MFFTKTKKLLKQTQAELDEFKKKFDDTNLSLERIKNENSEINEKYSSFIDRDAAILKLDQQISSLQEELNNLNIKYQNGLQIFSELEKDINLYKDTLEIGSFGLYEPQFNFQTSESYKNALENNYQNQKDLIKRDNGAICNTEWTVGGSKMMEKK